MDIALEPGERMLDSWSLIYRPDQGGPYNGKLTVTDRRLLYDPKSDVSVAGLFDRMGVVRVADDGIIEIRKQDITNIEVIRKFLRKQFILTLSDGNRFAFDRGAMNIDAVVAAVQGS